MSADQPVKVGILISGRGSNMQSLVAASREAGAAYQVALVASDKPEAAGLAWTKEQGIATFALSPQGIGKPAYEAAIDQALRDASVEVIALAGYMRLLSGDFVARWQGRIVNIHPSLLPAFKGLDVHQRVLAAGVRITGCTVHFVVPDMDSGPIIAQAAVPVAAGDTEDRLAARVLAAEHRVYPLAVRLVALGQARLEAGIVAIEEAGELAPALLNPPD